VLGLEGDGSLALRKKGLWCVDVGHFGVRFGCSYCGKPNREVWYTLRGIEEY